MAMIELLQNLVILLTIAAAGYTAYRLVTAAREERRAERLELLAAELRLERTHLLQEAGALGITRLSGMGPDDRVFFIDVPEEYVKAQSADRSDYPSTAAPPDDNNGFYST